MIDLRINLPDFNRQLTALKSDMQQKVVRAATAAAATVFKKKAIGYAPVLKSPKKNRVAGMLKRAIYVTRSRDRSPVREHYFVGVRQGKRGQKKGIDAFYWRWVEQGHLIRGRGAALRGGRRSKDLQRKRLNASGAKRVPAYPFLKPAFDTGRAEALRAFYDRLAARIEKANR